MMNLTERLDNGEHERCDGPGGCGHIIGTCEDDCCPYSFEYIPRIRYDDGMLLVQNSPSRNVSLRSAPPRVRVPIGVFEITRHGPRWSTSPVYPQEWWEL
jgi:hypothetical protein